LATTNNTDITNRVADLEAEAQYNVEFKQWNETLVEMKIIHKFFKSKMGYMSFD
jgi:hypothetical protein